MLAICAALDWEIRPILQAIGSVKPSRDGPLRLWHSTSRTRPVVVFRTGIGCDAASDATRRALHVLPIRTIINTGCAGALAANLTTGTVIIPTTLLYLSTASHDADEACIRRLREAARRAGLSSDDGPILTSPTVLATGTDKRAAHEQFGATAVEMEGYAVANVAREHSSRFGSVRAILDTSELDLPSDIARQSKLQVALRSAVTARQRPALASLANAVNEVQTSLEGLFRRFLNESPSN
jgi:adenosylhomocysteine nucleosidase